MVISSRILTVAYMYMLSEMILNAVTHSLVMLMMVVEFLQCHRKAFWETHIWEIVLQ